MIFEISRTSGYTPADEPPCDGCTETSVYISWREKTQKVYLKEINTLEELMNFIQNEGEGQVVILSKGTCNDCNYPEIEIYDSFRE